MDILILNWKDIKNPEVGGAEIIAFEFARRLVQDGHNVTFFSRFFKGGLNEEIVDGVKIVRRGNKLSVYIHAYLYYKSLTSKPDKVIDMINTICWQTPLYVEKRKRIAYVNQLAKEVLFYELPWYLSYPAYFLERIEYIPYKSTKFLCYSESTKKDLMGFGIKEKNILVFPLGIDHKRYRPGKKKSKHPLFIFVARLVKMKRADLCIRAMSYVTRKYPDSKLAIVGTGVDIKRLQTLVKELKLGDNVSFVNKDNFFVNENKRDVKVALMQEAWVLLLPSVKEGWGMVVTEAAACSTPSIVTNVTGLRDCVIPDRTGIIIPKNPTVLEVTNAMMQIIEDSAKRENLSKEAMKRSRNFSWDKSYKDFKSYVLPT